MRLCKTAILLSALCTFSCFGDIQIENPRARATFVLAQTGALYFSIINDSNQSDKLVSVSVQASVAEAAELHQIVMVSDMMRMEQINGGIPVQAHSKVELSPGGKHIMLLGLKHALEVGDNIDITLSFANAAPKLITVPVIKM